MSHLFIFATSFILFFSTHVIAQESQPAMGFRAYLDQKAKEQVAAPESVSAQPQPEAVIEEKKTAQKPKKKKKKEKSQAKSSSEPSSSEKHASVSQKKSSDQDPSEKKAHEIYQPRSVASEFSTTKNSAGKENSAELILKTDSDCYVVEFPSLPGGTIHCTEALDLKYTQRDCATSKVMEIGGVKALVSCSDSKRIGIRFRTSSDVIYAILKIQREHQGKAGIAAQYRVESVVK